MKCVLLTLAGKDMIFSQILLLPSSSYLLLQLMSTSCKHGFNLVSSVTLNKSHLQRTSITICSLELSSSPVLSVTNNSATTQSCHVSALSANKKYRSYLNLWVLVVSDDTQFYVLCMSENTSDCFHKWLSCLSEIKCWTFQVFLQLNENQIWNHY